MKLLVNSASYICADHLLGSNLIKPLQCHDNIQGGKGSCRPDCLADTVGLR